MYAAASWSPGGLTQNEFRWANFTYECGSQPQARDQIARPFLWRARLRDDSLVMDKIHDMAGEQRLEARRISWRVWTPDSAELETR